MISHFTRGLDNDRGKKVVRGDLTPRGKAIERGEKIHSSRQSLMRGISDNNNQEGARRMSNIITMAGKEVGSPVVVFPDNIAGGSFIPGTIVRIIEDTLLQISVGTVTIQDGEWKPVNPFVAGDQVFIPIEAIDSFV
jgi:hypothetical protein